MNDYIYLFIFYYILILYLLVVVVVLFKYINYLWHIFYPHNMRLYDCTMLHHCTTHRPFVTSSQISDFSQTSLRRLRPPAQPHHYQRTEAWCQLPHPLAP